MTKSFSPLKAFKVGLTSLALVGSCLMANTASAFVHTQGTKIVDDNNQPLFFNGTNLGNWLVWEGYMMMDDSKERNGVEFRTHTQFFWGLERAFGTTKALEFEKTWRQNYVTEATIEELRGLGYNSVRVPFKWSLLWNGSSLNAEGISYIDNLISWCKPRGIKILLDMHGLPGYQNPGDHSDNIYSNKDHPQESVRFLDGTTRYGQIGDNIVAAGNAWSAIAAKYASEPTIWGYDIMNEPKTGNDKNAEDLLVAQKYIISRIRLVDPNHVVVVEGDNWASWMDMYNVNSSGWNGSKLDSKSNVVLQTHHYIWGNLGNLDLLNKRADIAKNMNVPIILGEIGEDTESVLRELAVRAKDQQYSGVYSWTFKKVFKEYRSLWAVVPTRGSAPDDAYLELRDAIDGWRSFNGSWENLKTFITYNIRNGHKDLHWWKPFYDNTAGVLRDASPITTPSCVRSAYKAVALPGTVQAEDFDNGCANVVYADSTTGNAGATTYRNTDVDIGTTADSSGLYVGWTSQGEWLEYTVNVAQSGNYTFDFRYAAVPYGATVTVTAGSNAVTTNLNPTGGWDTWLNATSAPVALSAGSQVIRVTFNGGANLNSFTATAAGKNLPPLGNTYVVPHKYNIVAKKSPYVSGTIGIGLDAPKTIVNNNYGVQQYTIWGSGGSNQQWDIQPVQGLVNTYKIVNVGTGMVLDVPLSAGCVGDSAALNQYTYGATSNQMWKFVQTGYSSWTIVSAATPCGNTYEVLDVANGIVQDGKPMQVYSLVPGNDNQQWSLIPVN